MVPRRILPTVRLFLLQRMGCIGSRCLLTVWWEAETTLRSGIRLPSTANFDRQGAAISYTDLEFGYTITHIEDHITEVVDGYESSVWLSGASNGALASLTAQGSVRLEFPVLYFPEAPVFTRQQFILEEDFTVRYSVTYAKSRHLP